MGLESHGEYKTGVPNGNATYFWCNGDLTDRSPDITPLDKAKSECEELGVTPGTEKYGGCVLRLMGMH